MAQLIKFIKKAAVEESAVTIASLLMQKRFQQYFVKFMLLLITAIISCNDYIMQTKQSFSYKIHAHTLNRVMTLIDSCFCPL